MSDNVDNELIRKVNELQQEAKEHQLVLEAFKLVEPTRKCFRLIGGILVERTVQDIQPSLEENLENIEKAIDNLSETIVKRREQRTAQAKSGGAIESNSVPQSMSAPTVPSAGVLA